MKTVIAISFILLAACAPKAVNLNFQKSIDQHQLLTSNAWCAVEINDQGYYAGMATVLRFNPSGEELDKSYYIENNETVERHSTFQFYKLQNSLLTVYDGQSNLIGQAPIEFINFTPMPSFNAIWKKMVQRIEQVCFKRTRPSETEVFCPCDETKLNQF